MKYSIIVPVYNIDFVFLDKCIQSVLNQELEDYEVIIVDDGSKEEVAKKCDSYEGGRVKVIHQPNKGLAGARNIGIAASSGEWIIHVDADDWIDRELLTEVDSATEEAPDIIVFGFRSIDKNDIRDHLLKNKSAFNNEYNNIKTDVMKSVMCSSTAFDYLALNTTWGKVFKRSFIESLSIEFDENLRRAQDVIYNLPAFWNAGKIGYVDKCLYNYRIDDGASLSKKYNPETAERMTKTANACIAFVEKYPDNNELKHASYNFVRFCFGNIIGSDFYNSENTQSLLQKRKRFIETLRQEPYHNAFKFKNYCHIRLLDDIETVFITLRCYFTLGLFRKLRRTMSRLIPH